MKFRNGVLECCPFCAHRRIAGELIDSFTQDTKEGPKVFPARKHQYSCGAEIIEVQTAYKTKSLYLYLTVTKACPAVFVTVSKGLSFVANYYDIGTLSSYELCDLVAEKVGNITAKLIHYAITCSSMLQDKYRLPPIPLLESHRKYLDQK